MSPRVRGPGPHQGAHNRTDRQVERKWKWIQLALCVAQREPDEGPNNSGPNQGRRDEGADNDADEGPDGGPNQVRARLATAAPPSL